MNIHWGECLPEYLLVQLAYFGCGLPLLKSLVISGVHLRTFDFLSLTVTLMGNGRS